MSEFKNKKECVNSKYSREELINIAINLGLNVKASSKKSDVCSCIEKYTKKIIKDTKARAKRSQNNFAKI